MSTLQIERLRCRYRVPREHPNPWAVQTRLDQLVREGLVEGGWTDAVASLVSEDEDSVLVIRRLDLKLLLGIGVPEDARLNALWRRGLARALARALEAEPDGRWLIRFPSRAAYLARFAENLVAGTAASAWYYEPFRPLLALPASAALRETLRREPAAILPTLVLLDERGRLGWVTAILSDTDANAILSAITPAAGESALRTDATLRAAVEAGRLQRWWSDCPAIVALHLLAATTRADGEQAPARSLLEAVHAVAQIVPVLRAQDAGAGALPARLIEHIRRIDDADRALTTLRTNHPAVAAALVRAASSTTVAAAPEREDRFATPFGGIFLLLPSLAEMDLGALLRQAGFGEDDVAWAAPLSRWLLLLACLGSQHRAVGRLDPALTLAAGLDRPPDRAALRRLARVTAPLARSLGEALAAWAERTHRTSGTAPSVEAVRAPSRRWVLLERDSGSGLWLRVAPLDRRPEPVQPPRDGLPPAAGEVAYFHLGGLLRGHAAGLAWSQIAAVLLNVTARRLPGFAGSSAGYLCHNFLAGTSLIERDAGGVSVDLPRVPLRVVMRMAGTAGRHEIPWLAGGTLLIDGSEAYNPEHE